MPCCRVRHKPKMTVVLTKSARFDETIMAEGAHGSYANDDEDTYEDADYSDAAFRDPRVPDVGEGDIAQARPATGWAIPRCSVRQSVCRFRLMQCLLRIRTQLPLA